MLVVLGVLLPELAYGNFDGVRTGMKQPRTDLRIKPDNLVLIQGYCDTSMPPLEDGSMFAFGPAAHHDLSDSA
jgi:hypothetical protein